MSKKMNFQEIILRSLDFWKEKGCLVWHPHNVQVGAGTMNPATVLRVLGPEPWNVVYIEPSIRPDDGRFGDNPNRMQQHYQLQVILQPDPGNPQELYLESLEAIGFDLRQHDVRFVEDNWQQPALGAWGLGWEVWLDGQEITQFTYFQQAGSANLDPVAVELTYGLDRIALALQDVDSVWDIDYGANIEYGDLLLQSEIEHCRYYFDEADVDALKRVYDIYEGEALRCLDAKLIAPAHDFNLKCSFLFNVMDTRGAIGVTERAQYFRRMRSVARKIANQYIEQRTRLEYPFMDAPLWQKSLEAAATSAAGEGPIGVETADAQTFVLEIGCEELPSGDLASAINQLQGALGQELDNQRLSYDKVSVQGTPRRVVAIVEGLAPRQHDVEKEVKGPPADRAFDKDGNPTKAAVGFARSRGIDPKSLKIVADGERRYAAAVIKEEGEPVLEVLSKVLPDLIAELKFEISMRWNESNISFSRPIRWLMALYGGRVVPFSYAGVSSGRLSRGLRGSGPTLEAADPEDYLSKISSEGILLAPSERREVIDEAARALAEEVGGSIRADSDLMAEVVNLVERPTLLRGSFEERFLELPVPVLVAVMKKHQRYFPVYDRNQAGLLPFFITVRNGGREFLDVVQSGNEHVIRARFADAEFFYKKDSQLSLEQFIPKLETMTFQTDLGSMLEKVQRLEQAVPLIGDQLGFSGQEIEYARRAATLSKADLASNMVVEMTSLQGVMGGIYAEQSGEEDAVVEAIAEQYRGVSQTRPGLSLALADRLDSLLGLFAAGLAPKGSNDPFGLRRAAIQIIDNLVSNETSFDVRKALAAAGPLQPVSVDNDHVEQVLAFIQGRLRTYLQEKGYRKSVIRAVVKVQGQNPYQAATAAAELKEAISGERWPMLLDSYSRCVRITRDQPRFSFNNKRRLLPQEETLFDAASKALENHDGSISGLIRSLEELEPYISDFFDNVLVMDEDPAIRENRLALLQMVAALTDGIVDLSELEGF